MGDIEKLSFWGPKKRAFIRFGRGLAATVIAAGMAYAINNYAAALDEAGLVAFTSVVGSALLALDKYLRERNNA
jgi:hypothetical protein